MGLAKLADKCIKRMKWYDISLVKLDVFFFTLFLITVWAGFRDIALSIAWYWYLAITVVIMVPLLNKIFRD